jgi:hypothetical protein
MADLDDSIPTDENINIAPTSLSKTHALTSDNFPRIGIIDLDRNQLLSG